MGLSLAATPSRAQCTGNCGADGADGVVTLSPTGHSTYQYISTYGGVSGAGEIPGVGGTNGSELASAVFNVTGKESLEFYFNYVTSDGAGFSDYAWAELQTLTGDHVAWLFTARTEPAGNTSPGVGLPANDSTLVPATSPIIPGGPVWSKLGGSSGECYDAGCGYTGWIQSTYDIAAAGSYKVVFGVTNWSDTEYDSGLAFDGLQAGGNPIPTGCSGAPGVNIKASAGQTCFASGLYVSTDVIAGQATGAGAVLTNVNESQSSFSFSTSAAGVPAVQADSGGSITLAVTPSSTTGTVTTTGNASIGLRATGSSPSESGSVPSSIQAQNIIVTTHGAAAPGVQADAGGRVTLTGGGVTTSGDNAFGIYATGAGSKVSADGVAVLTTGVGSHGAKAVAGAALSFAGGSIETQGNGGEGVVVTGPGTTFDATGLAVTTRGTYTSFTAGAFPLALDVSGGATATVTGGSFTTWGNSAADVSSVGAGTNVSLSGGTQVATHGLGAPGLSVGAGATLTANGVSVTTSGAQDPSDGYASVGAYNGGSAFYSGGGTLSLTNTSIETQGAGAPGVMTADGGATTISGGSVTTQGSGAHGLYATGAGSKIDANASGSAPVAIVTSGVGAFGVRADAGGAVTLVGGSVATSGAGASGLAAFGTGSSVGATGVAIATTGDLDAASSSFPFGVVAAGGGAVTVSGGSVTTGGKVAHAVVAGDGGTVTLSGGTHVVANGDGSAGLFVNGAGASLTATGISVTTHGNVGPAPFSFPAVGAYNGSASPGATAGGLLKLVDTTLATTGDGAVGVMTNAGGTTTIKGGSVSTSGADATGLVAAGAGTRMTGESVAVSTLGFGSHGAMANAGAALSLAGGAIATSGQDTIGVVAFGAGSSVGLDGTQIASTGFGGLGLVANGTGAAIAGSNIAVSVSGEADVENGYTPIAVASFGSGAAAGGGTVTLTNATLTVTSPSKATGIYNADGGTVSFSGGSISVSGDASLGVDAWGGSTTTLSAASIAMTGLGSRGVLASDAGTAVNLSNVTVKTSGGAGPNGGFSQALLATRRATISATGGTLETTGNSATVVSANTGALVTLAGTTIGSTGDGAAGLAVHGAEIDATNVTIATTGGRDPVTGDRALGAYNGPYGAFPAGGVLKLTNSTVSTAADGMHGVYTTTGGTTTLSGTGVTTAGAGALALLADNGGVVSATGGSLATTGRAAYAAAVNAGGSMAVNGTSVSAAGAGSGGVAVNGAASVFSAMGVTVSTTGGADPVSGQNAYGVYNGPSGAALGGGTASFTHSSILTAGAQTAGVLTTTGGTTTLAGTSVATSGAGSVGVVSIAGGATLLNGASVATSGEGGHALMATGAGSTAALAGTSTFATTGAGAVGVYAALGGAVGLSGGSSITTVTTAGGVSAATGLAASGVVADGAGSTVALGAANVAVSGAGAYGLLASDAAASGHAGAITVSGPLSVTTTNAAATAIGLQGNGASIVASGGGTIQAAGNAFAFLDGSAQLASLANFTVNAKSGDFVYSDPSTATINLANSTVFAANILNAALGSTLTFNASASTLTGAALTDPTSTSNLNLANGTTWTLTGPSNLTRLGVTNSVVVFAPPGAGGGFATLTVGNYVGSGATIVMNAALGGNGSGANQIIINGGSATGYTLLSIRNVGGLGGAATGIPLVITTNGGTIAPNAFALDTSPVVNGYRYTLEETNGQLVLVSAPTTTPSQMQNSVDSVAKAQQAQMVTGRVLSSLLIGATQQISCSSCGSGFASFGSLALGMQGRWTLNPEVTAIGGMSYNEWNAQGVSVTNAPTFAGSLIWDMSSFGSSRPFLQAGAGVTPYESVNTARSYQNGAWTATGYSTSVDRSLSLFARAGWLARLTPTDEVAAYGDIGRSWMTTGGYTEAASALNPYPASAGPGLETLNVVRAGGQVTHLFFGRLEANLSAAVAYGFGSGAGPVVNIDQFGPIAPGAVPNSAWVEYGGRLGYRVSNNLVLDGFVLGTAGGQVGATIHGGVAVRFAF